MFIGLTIQEAEFRGPLFDVQPSSTVIFTNDTGVFLHCTAFGNPPPEVRWRTLDDEIVEDVTYLRHIFSNGTLQLRAFDPRYYRADVHSTTYVCFAKNSVGVVRGRNVTVTAGTEDLIFYYLKFVLVFRISSC